MRARWLLVLVSLLGSGSAWAQPEFSDVYSTRAPATPTGLSCTYTATSATTMNAAATPAGPLVFTFDETDGEASCNWTAVETDPFNMITVSQPTFGTGTGSFQISVVVDPNPGSARSAMVQITNTRGDPLDFTITQDAGTCTYTVSDGIAPVTSRSFESVGGSGQVDVTTQAGCQWDVGNLMPGAGCISITAPSLPTSGSGTLFYSVSALGAMDPARNCTMDFTGDGAFSQTYTIMQSATTCDYSLDTSASPVLPSAGGSNVDDVVLTVTPAGCAWSVTADMPWITPAPTMGTATDTIDITLSANNDAMNRSGSLTFRNGSNGIEEVYTVTQSGQGCSPSVNPTSSSLGSGAGGSSFNVTVGAGCAWTASAVSTGNFVTVTPPGSGTGNGVLNYTVSANAGNARAGTITVTSEGQMANHTVNQSGVGCSITVSPATENVGAGGNGSLQASVFAGAGCAWTVSDNQPWITPVTMNGSGNGTISYSVDANALTSPRAGVLTATLTSNAQFDSVNVSQAGVGCAAFTVDPSLLNFTAAGPPLSMPVTITGTANALCTWTTVESVDWLTISPASGNGLDDTSTTVTVDPNPNPTPRSTVITIAGNPVTVMQDEQQCIFTLSPNSLNAMPTGDAGSISVTNIPEDPTCTWTAQSNDPWINLTQAGLMGNNVLLIDDQFGFGGAAAVLTGDLHTVTELTFEAFFGYPNLLNPGFLAGFDIIVWGARGTDDLTGSSLVPAQVVVNLENYIQGGGHLIVTGLNSLAFTPVLQALVRSSTFGDRASFDPTWNTAATDNFILNGPYGDFRSLSFLANGYDDDNVTADTGAGAQALVTNPSGDRIIFTDLTDPAGSVGYWNGGDFTFSNAQPDFSDGGNPQDIFRNWVCGIGSCAVPGGTGSGSLDYTIDANDGLALRTGTANIAGNVFQVDQDAEPSFLINEVRASDNDGFEIVNVRATPVNLNKLGLAVTGVIDTSFGFGDFSVMPGAVVGVTFGTGLNVWNPGEPGSLLFTDNATGKGVDIVRWANSVEPAVLPDVFSGTVTAPLTKDHVIGRDKVSTDSNDAADWCIQFPSFSALNTSCVPPVMINEVFPDTPDYFEIYNFSTGSVDVTNWMVESTGTAPNMQVLPGRILSAGEYVRIEEFDGFAAFPETCTFELNPIDNCSFENGLSGWIVSDAMLPFFAVQTGGAGISPPPEFGLFSSAPTDETMALLHGFDANDASGAIIEVAQDVTVPLDGAILYFEYRVGWDLFNFCPDCSLDREFRVEVQPSGGGAPMSSDTVLTISPQTIVGDTGNIAGRVGLSSFAGQNVRLAFVWDIPEQSTGPAFFQLDNVSINSVPPGTILTGGNLSWVAGGVGSITLSDDMGEVVDFIRWGGSPTPPPAQPGPPWNGDAPTPPTANDSIGRNRESTDTNTGRDWCVLRPSSGDQNPLCDGEILLRTSFEDDEDLSP